MKPFLTIATSLCAGVSLFRLGSHLFHLRFSQVVEPIIATYETLLIPVIALVGPILVWAAALADLELPVWWPHAFVVWVVLGGIAGRAWAKNRSYGEPEYDESLFGAVFGLTFGLLAFLWCTTIAIHESRSSWDDDYLWYIAKEMFWVVAATVFFFATNAFA